MNNGIEDPRAKPEGCTTTSSITPQLILTRTSTSIPSLSPSPTSDLRSPTTYATDLRPLPTSATDLATNLHRPPPPTSDLRLRPLTSASAYLRHRPPPTFDTDLRHQKKLIF